MSADGKHQARVARMVFISMEGTFTRLVFVTLDSVSIPAFSLWSPQRILSQLIN